MVASVLQMDLTKAKARQIIAEILTDSSRVKLTTHVQERMIERSISIRQVFKCLEHGSIIEGPYRDSKGNWKLNLETITSGDRVVLACALDHDSKGNYCVVITTF